MTYCSQEKKRTKNTQMFLKMGVPNRKIPRK